MLLGAAAIWGFGFVAQDAIEGLGASTVVAVRNWIASIFLIIVIIMLDRLTKNGRTLISKKGIDINRTELIGGVFCGVILASASVFQQIGIDVLPEYRRQGVASALTSALALEILRLGKVPFYCAAWSNIPSVRNAIRSGFRPAWAELTARDTAFVEKMNA